MKQQSLKFFKAYENEVSAGKSSSKKPPVTGYLSVSGKLVLPFETFRALSIDPLTIAFRVGHRAGKRLLDALFLVPTPIQDGDGFPLVKTSRHYTISIGTLLQNRGVDFKQVKYFFTITPFAFDNNVTGYMAVFSVPLGGKRADKAHKQAVKRGLYPS